MPFSSPFRSKSKSKLKVQAIVENETLTATQSTLATDRDGSERFSMHSGSVQSSTRNTSIISQDFLEKLDQELTPHEVPRGTMRDKDQQQEAKLHPLPTLIGRAAEDQALQETFYLTVERSCRALLNITGDSGSGKSSLAANLRSVVEEFGGIFVSSKFDLQCNVPCSALVQAFSGIVSYLLKNQHRYEVVDIIENVRRAVELQRETLKFLVPNIDRLFPDLDEQYSLAVVDGRQAMLHYAVREFIGAVASEDRPLVIVINDLQNVDEASLGILDALLADQRGDSILFVTTAREEGPNIDAWRDKVAQVARAEVTLQQIHLDPLSEPAVLEMVSASLNVNKESKTLFQHENIQQLAGLVHKKTAGNAFFVLQFLQNLVDQNLLKYSTKRQWTWNLTRIQKAKSTTNVADLMKAKLQRLDRAGQVCISIAAHLGQSFNLELLEVVLFETFEDQENRDLLALDLRHCVQAGLLEQQDPEDAFNYTFVHDQVQDAAIKLMGDADVPIRQAQIGQKLLMHHKAMPSDDCLFLGVDLCITGMDTIEGNEEQRSQLAAFMRQAGDLAFKKAAFQQALKYYESGLTCLSHKRWEENHELFLALTSGAAEASLCSANHLSLETHLASILGRDMTLDDKMRAYMMRIKSYGEKEKFQQAIEIAVDIYNQMGFGTSLPTNPGKIHVVMELLKTKKVLKKHTQETLLALPLMEDERRIAAMGIIDMLAVPAYSASPMLYVLIWLRAVRWSVKFGVCKYSATAFSRFSAVVGAVLKKPQDAFVYAQVALGLSGRLEARDTLAKTVAGVYGFTLHWAGDLTPTLNPLLYGYQVGMQTGDVEYAFHSLLHYNVASWLAASQDLVHFVSDLEEHCELMSRYNQKALYTITSYLLHMCKAFQGGSDYATGASFSTRLLDNVEMPDSGMFVLAHRTMKLAMMHLCYFFGNYKEALVHAKESADVGTKVAQGYLFVPRHRFLYGMISVASARSRFDRKIKFAKTIVKTLDQWVGDGRSDCEHYSQLLDAEIAGVQGQFVKAADLYKAALETAERFEYEHDTALVYERAGLFYLNGNNRDRASYHLGQAIVHYRKWGAQAKVQQLLDVHGELIPSSFDGR